MHGGLWGIQRGENWSCMTLTKIQTDHVFPDNFFIKRFSVLKTWISAQHALYNTIRSIFNYIFLICNKNKEWRCFFLFNKKMMSATLVILTVLLAVVKAVNEAEQDGLLEYDDAA